MNFKLSIFIFSVIIIAMPLASLGHGGLHSDKVDLSAKKNEAPRCKQRGIPGYAI